MITLDELGRMLAERNIAEALALVTGEMRISLHNEEYPEWIAVIWIAGLEDRDHWLGQDPDPATAVLIAYRHYMWRKQDSQEAT